MNKIRDQFPIFSNIQNNLAYLDTAASAQKPVVVLRSLQDFYSNEYANIHRGAYELSASATIKFEESRLKVAKFLNATSAKEVIFTRNATEGINLIASTLLQQFEAGDTILLTELEHHSNLVPWQIQAKRQGLIIHYAKITPEAQIDLLDFKDKLVKFQPKICSFTMHSNAFGTITPYQEMIKAAKDVGSLVLLDACQAVLHQPIDVQNLATDFLVFSGHKLYGPTGIGVLYGREELLNNLPPYQGGGDMISSVSITGSTWAEIPAKFEAGTPAIAEAIGLGTAIDFVSKIGWEQIQKNDQVLSKLANEMLKDIPGVNVYGALDPSCSSSILSFNLESVHPHDLASICDQFNVQIRAGFHCAMPALQAMNLNSTARISFGVYSQESDLLQLEKALWHAKKLFKV